MGDQHRRACLLQKSGHGLAHEGPMFIGPGLFPGIGSLLAEKLADCGRVTRELNSGKESGGLGRHPDAVAERVPGRTFASRGRDRALILGFGLSVSGPAPPGLINDVPLNVEELAGRVNMAPSTFHKHFKELTTLSPLQYQKRLRLGEARRLLLANKCDVTQAAFAVGYESATQFIREYKRLFGDPPRRDVTRMKALTSGGTVAVALAG